MSVRVKSDELTLARIYNQYKNNINQIVEITDEEAIELGIIEPNLEPSPYTPPVPGEEDPDHDYSQDYLTITSLEDNNIIRYYGRVDNNKIIFTSKDKIHWNEYAPSDIGTIIGNLNNNEKLFIKENLMSNGSILDGNSINTSKLFNISGNIMSYIYGDNFINQTSLDSVNSANFSQLFYNCSKLISAKNLILPATTLTPYCYANMFQGCSALTTTPELPATTLADYCYIGMFQECKSLTTPPELPATTLANGCYQNMFQSCTSLIVAPELLATTLVTNCYADIFYGCNSLNYIKCLATDVSILKCTYMWVGNVAASGAFIKNLQASYDIGWSGIPAGWTVQELDPETGEIVNEYIAGE